MNVMNDGVFILQDEHTRMIVMNLVLHMDIAMNNIISTTCSLQTECCIDNNIMN